MTDLARLVGEDAEHLWDFLPYKKLYYKNGDVFGIIGVIEDNGVSVVYSMSNDEDKFSFGMVRDIRKMYDNLNLALITNKEYAYGHIRNTLEPYGFTFHYAELDNGQKFMYSIHIKGE
jgi:hypothetical protein